MENEYNVQDKLQGQRKANAYVTLAKKMSIKKSDVRGVYLKLLDSELKKYNTLADKMSRQQAINAQGLKNLRSQALNICNICEQYLATKVGKEKNAFNDVFRNVGHTMQKDFKTMSNARIDQNTTFADMIRSSKERSITISGQGGERVGGDLNQRMLLQVRDRNGKTVKGLFTKNSTLDYEKCVNEDMIRWRREYPELVPMFDSIAATSSEIKKSRKPGLTVTELLLRSFSRSTERNTGEPIAAATGTVVEPIVAPYKNTPAYKAWARDFGKTVMARRLQAERYNWIMNLPQGSNIDGRSSAMSAMADMLHCGDLLARSVPMEVIGPDGKAVHGTFSEFVDGSDINHLSVDDPYLHSDPNNFEAPSGMKSVANLGVLDFICGNIDRHEGNMLYRFDENNKLIGLKGIDNDMAFGNLTRKDLTDGCVQMSGIGNLQLVGEDMGNAIKALTPEVLMANLRGYGLGKAEIINAAKRLEMVKNAIKTGAIKTVKDNEWADYSLQGLLANCSGKCMFTTVASVSLDQEKHAENLQAMLKGKAALDPYVFGEANVEKSKENYTKLAEHMGEYVQKLKNVNSGFFVGSREFDNMMAYTEYMRDEFGRMSRETLPEGVDPESFRKSRFEKTKLMMDSLRDLTGMYLNHRAGDGKLATNATAQKRALAATELNAMALNNCNRFNLPDRELYLEGINDQRKNAYMRMSAKEIGNRIKNIKNMAKRHPNDPNIRAEAQKSLNRYFGRAMGKNLEAYGIAPEELPQDRQANQANRQTARRGNSRQEFINELDSRMQKMTGGKKPKNDSVNRSNGNMNKNAGKNDNTKSTKGTEKKKI